MTFLRTLCLSLLLCGLAAAQYTDCRGCRGIVTGFGGSSNGVTVIVDNLGASSGSCGDTEAGQCTPTDPCSFNWDMVVLVAPGSAAISTVTICPVDSRNRCIGPPATSQAPIFNNATAYVRGYQVACGWRHQQDITDVFGNLVGGVSLLCTKCELIILPD